MPFESTHFHIIKGRESYHRMTSTKVMQEICSFKVASKLANDSRNRAIGMAQGASKALKAKVVTKEVDEEEELSYDEEPTALKLDEYEGVLHDYMALKHHVFWKNMTKAKAYVQEHSPSIYTKGGTQKLRSCFNC